MVIIKLKGSLLIKTVQTQHKVLYTPDQGHLITKDTMIILFTL